MGATFNPNTASSLGKIFTGVSELLQAVGGGAPAGAPTQPAPAAQPAPQAPQGPVDQFQPAPNAGGAPAQNTGAAQGAAQPQAGGDIASKISQLVQALTSVIQMISQMLGKGGQAGAGAGAGAGAQAGAGAGAQAGAGAGAGAQASASASASASAGAGAKGDAFSQMQAQFGAWHGKGKNASAPTGPQAKKLVAEAEAKMSSGDTAGAQKAYQEAQKTSSPVALDLTGKGGIETTGVSTAKNRADNQVGNTIQFDMDGDGKKENVEWMKAGSGQGLVVDDRDGGATAAMNGNGEINGSRLMGDQGGKFANGYEKMKQHDTNGDGKISGEELKGLKTWVDNNGDGKVDQGELKSMDELGITELDCNMQNKQNARGENLMQSSFTQNGQKKLSEDVWFAQK